MDWFELDLLTSGNCVIQLLLYIFDNESFYEPLSITTPTLFTFAQKIQEGYFF